jgi:hypothetical protein
MVRALGPRLPYEAAPGPVRAWVDRQLGSQVVASSTQYGGFSPGVAARLVTASGRRAFVKAVGIELNPDSPGLFRQESVVMQALDPLRLSQAPRLYGGYDDGAWVALLLEDIEGRTAPHPWPREDAVRVLDAIDELTLALTPSPWREAPVAAERSVGFLTGWERVIANGIDLPDAMRGCEAGLLELAQRGRQAVARGDGLAHWDIRSDNLLLTEDRVVFVDWAWAARAAPWADQVFIRVDIRTGDGVPDVPDLPDDDGITGFLAAFVGGLWWACHQPPPQGLPTLRTFQRDSAEAALGWLDARLS